MSINFEEDMGPEAQNMIRRMFDVDAMDEKIALLRRIEKPLDMRQLIDIARAAKQPATLEWNKIGDRKEVDGIVYELDEKGWRRLPIGTDL